MKYVYKIVAAILALGVIPMSLFSPIFYYRIKSTALQALLYIGQKKGLTVVSDFLEKYDTLPDSFANTLSLTNVINKGKTVFSLSSLFDSDGKTDATLQALKTPAITTAVLFLFILICALVTAILAIACKNNRKPIYSSIIGIGLCVIFNFSFNSLVAPFLSGEITLSSFTNINALIAGLLGNFDALSLAASFWLIPALFAAVCIWTVCYNITLPEKEKLERKRMLGEYEEK